MRSRARLSGVNFGAIKRWRKNASGMNPRSRMRPKMPIMFFST